MLNKSFNWRDLDLLHFKVNVNFNMQPIFMFIKLYEIQLNKIFKH